jgi:hypothetical protein
MYWNSSRGSQPHWVASSRDAGAHSSTTERRGSEAGGRIRAQAHRTYVRPVSADTPTGIVPVSWFWPAARALETVGGGAKAAVDENRLVLTHEHGSRHMVAANYTSASSRQDEGPLITRGSRKNYPALRKQPRWAACIMTITRTHSLGEHQRLSGPESGENCHMLTEATKHAHKARQGSQSIRDCSCDLITSNVKQTAKVTPKTRTKQELEPSCRLHPVGKENGVVEQLGTRGHAKALGSMQKNEDGTVTTMQSENSASPSPDPGTFKARYTKARPTPT